MHYPLHITALCAALWILQVDSYAVKNGFGAEMLASFAKNVASILSTTLLADYQDQLPAELLKKIQDDPSSLVNTENEQRPVSTESSNSSSDGLLRRTRQSDSSNEVRGAFQAAYVTSNPSGYPKYYHPDSYKPYEFAVNRDVGVAGNVDKAEDIRGPSVEARDNSIDTDIEAASRYYYDRSQRPSEPSYASNPARPPSNFYANFELQPRYQRLPAQTPDTPVQPSLSRGVEAGSDVNGNVQASRITRRPYNFNYHGPLHAPYPDTFHRHPGFYPHEGGSNEGNGQPSPPAVGQDESNPSRLIDDQNQGQSTLGGGYDYSPHLHYRPPYHAAFHHGFHHGFPGFPYQPQNGSFDPGNAEQIGGNTTNGHFPYGPPNYPDYRFNPYVPYYPYPHPSFYEHRRPVEPQNIPEGSPGNAEQAMSPETEQPMNGTVGKRPFYGFPPYGPVYGDFYVPGYPVLRFNGLPYHHHHHHHFGHGYHTQPFPYFKAAPYSYFPLGPWYPYFGGYYPPRDNNGRGPVMMMMMMTPEKATEMEKTANGNSEGPPANSDVEMVSESKAEETRQQKLSTSWPLTKEI